jgi:hypothetical protein
VVNEMSIAFNDVSTLAMEATGKERCGEKLLESRLQGGYKRPYCDVIRGSVFTTSLLNRLYLYVMMSFNQMKGQA